MAGVKPGELAIFHFAITALRRFKVDDGLGAEARDASHEAPANGPVGDNEAGPCEIFEEWLQTGDAVSIGLASFRPPKIPALGIGGIKG
jgi:hypothetical protein